MQKHMNVILKNLKAGKIRPLFKIGTIISWCLISAGKIIGLLLPIKTNRAPLFFFFPFFSTGGAEKVHADIIACFKKERPFVFFTHKSKNQNFKASFLKNARVIELGGVINNRFTYYLTIGFLAGYINRQTAPTVFGSNTAFFYNLLPYLKKDIFKVDLVHAFGGGLEEISLPFVGYLSKRVVVNGKTLSDFKDQYGFFGLSQYLDRIQIIENMVEVPAQDIEKENGTSLK